MEYTNDPRMRGFNYGTPSQTGPHPPVYHTAAKIIRAISAEATKASNEAWDLEMALRHVRLACTSTEKLQAVQNLERKIKPYLNGIAT